MGYLLKRLERNTREKERVCIELLFNLCKLLVVEIKQCVLSPLSVSKPPPVVYPTNTPCISTSAVKERQ